MRKRELGKEKKPKIKKERPPKVKKERPAKVKKEKAPKVKKERPPKVKKIKVPKEQKERKNPIAFLKRKKNNTNAPLQANLSEVVKKPERAKKSGKAGELINIVVTYAKKFGALILKGIKQIPKLKIFLPQKTDKNAPLLDSSVKVQPLFCIQTKLIGCFVIPVIMIIILGVTSFSKASTALTTNYEAAVTQSISMTKEYFDFVLTNIESDMNMFLSDQDLADYQMGVYDTSESTQKEYDKLKAKADKTEEALNATTEGSDAYYKAYVENSKAQDEMEASNDVIKNNDEKKSEIYATINANLANKIAANHFISNIFIVKDGCYNFTTQMSRRHKEANDSDNEETRKKIDEANTYNLYKEMLKTDLGKAVVKDSNSYHWHGPQPKLDKYFDTNSDNYILRVAHALTNVSDGLMFVDLRRDTIMDILKDLNLGEGSFIGIISPDGQELVTRGKSLDSSSDEEKKDKNAKEDVVKETVYADQDFYKEAVKSKEDKGSSYVKYNGTRYLFVYAKLGSSNMMLCSLIPKSVITAQVDTIKWSTIGMVIFAAIIALLVGTLISRGFSKTINRTIRELEKVSNGDLTVEFRTNRRDEFAKLYGSSNDMIHNIRSLIQEVQDVYGALQTALNQVDSSSSTFSQTTKDIQTSVHEIEIGISQQSDDACDCLTQMDNLFGKINVVNDNTTEIGAIAETTREAISAGMENMDNLNEKTTSTTAITNTIIQTIEELSERSNNIGQIVNTINDIAEETNLLSLNASIEAARAGNAGRGFAVVAGEIRKLADQCLASANKISGIVTEITASTTEAVEAARDADEIVQAQVMAVQSTTQSFATMNEHVALLTNYLNDITRSSKDMEQAGSSTLHSMESISSILEETSASISSVTTIVDMQTNALGTLDEASANLVTKAGNLGEAISKFTTN